MSKRIFNFIICFLISVAFAAAGNTFTLVIDAGHGGKDTGAIGDSLLEKDINLNVALMLGRMIEQNCRDVKVIYTRNSDVFIELDERANIANRNKANLFISIHTNALPKGRIAYGFETYTLGMARANENLEVAQRENSVITYEQDYKQKYEGFNPNSEESYIMFEFMQDKNMAQSVELAKDIQKFACETANRNNMGVHQAGFLVLRKTSMPSCLVELGFISTPEEAEYLASAEGQSNLALGIYKAFLNYRNKHDKGLTTPYQLPKTDIQTSPFVQSRNISQVAKPETRQSQKNESKPTNQKQTKKEPQEKTETKGKQSTKAKHEADAKPEQNDTEIVKDDGTTRSPGKNRTDSQVQKDAGKHRTTESIYANKKGKFFKIQFLVSSKLLKPDSEQFKGLENIDYYEENDLYKYTTGETSDYKEICEQCKKVRTIHPEAFVIAIYDGKKIPVAEAIKKK